MWSVNPGWVYVAVVVAREAARRSDHVGSGLERSIWTRSGPETGASEFTGAVPSVECDCLAFQMERAMSIICVFPSVFSIFFCNNFPDSFLLPNPSASHRDGQGSMRWQPLSHALRSIRLNAGTRRVYLDVLTAFNVFGHLVYTCSCTVTSSGHGK